MPADFYQRGGLKRVYRVSPDTVFPLKDAPRKMTFAEVAEAQALVTIAHGEDPYKAARDEARMRTYRLVYGR